MKLMLSIIGNLMVRWEIFSSFESVMVFFGFWVSLNSGVRIPDMSHKVSRASGFQNIYFMNSKNKIHEPIAEEAGVNHGKDDQMVHPVGLYQHSKYMHCSHPHIASGQG